VGVEILEFLAPGNSIISESLAPFTESCTMPRSKGQSYFEGSEILGISGPRKFCPGAEIPAIGRNF
jgi:hypothetical protein